MTIDALFDYAIVGGGACGLAVLLQIVEGSRGATRVAIIERHASVGPGLAYSSACIGTKVNLNARNMSLYPKDADHFDKWMKQNPRIPGGEEFPPREHFGKYLTSVMAAVQQKAKEKGITLIVYHDEAIDMDRIENGWAITLQSDTIITAKQVALALGNQMSQKHPQLNGTPFYFDNPWPNSRLLAIPKSASIAILGSSLTAIDEALFLYDRGYTGQIYLLSRSGQLPKVQARASRKPERAYTTWNLAREVEQNPVGTIFTLAKRLHKEMTLSNEGYNSNGVRKSYTDDALPVFRRDVQLARSGNVPGHAMLRETAQVSERYWSCMDELSQRAFLKEYMSIWMAHRFGMPLVTGERVLRLMESGQLKVLPVNTKRPISYADSTFTISVATTRGTIKADALVEATGIEYDASRLTAPLMGNLLRRQILRPHFAGGVHCNSVTLKANDGVYILGSMTRGVLFHCTGIDRNVPHAERLADDMLGLPPRKPLHVGLYVGPDVYSNLILSSIVPQLAAAGHLPFVFLSPTRTYSNDDNELSLLERDLYQGTVIPYLGSDHSSTGISSTVKQLKARFGMLVQTVCDVNDPEHIASLPANHIDVAFDIHSSQRFRTGISAHLASRHGVYTLQSVEGDGQLGHVLRDLSAMSNVAQDKVIDVSTTAASPHTTESSLQDGSWNQAAAMLLAYTNTKARGLPTAQTTLTQALNPYNILSKAFAHGGRYTDAEAMKTQLVSHFAPEGHETSLRNAIDAVCRVRDRQNNAEQTAEDSSVSDKVSASEATRTPVGSSERSRSTAATSEGAGSVRMMTLGEKKGGPRVVVSEILEDGIVREVKDVTRRNRRSVRRSVVSWARFWKKNCAA